MKISDVKPGMRIIDEGAMYDSYALLKIDSVSTTRVQARQYGRSMGMEMGELGWQEKARTRKLYHPRLISDHLTDDEVIKALNEMRKVFDAEQQALKAKYHKAVSDFVCGANPYPPTENDYAVSIRRRS